MIWQFDLDSISVFANQLLRSCSSIGANSHEARYAQSNADFINKCGRQLENLYQVNYLFADFKKRNGYKRSIELTKKYELYRQNYCGCEFSLKALNDKKVCK